MGVVQGVGFRPFICNEATKAGLQGYVQNVGEGVVIVVDKKEALLKIITHLPPLARIDSLEITEHDEEVSGFSIRESYGTGHAEIPPDLFLCNECLSELHNPKDRRQGYFFITCTNCGPRFSIIQKTPYDRKNTTMDDFPLCNACKKEFTHPLSRRYHAQTIACHECGPTLHFLKNGKKAGGLCEAIDAVKRGEIIAIKGVGGFHWVCQCTDKTVMDLRRLSGRQHKPYALMVKDIYMLKQIALPTKDEIRLLQSPQRPIVLVKKKVDFQEISELDTLGVMLPYTALHYLLFDHYDKPLVMTSANMPDDPLAQHEEEAGVSTILTHTRRIENTVDDSVMKIISGIPFSLRRSRGFVPQSLPLLGEGCCLALGADMNNTIALSQNNRVYLSQHLGNLWNQKTYERYKKTITTYLSFFAAKPVVIIGDLHPDFFSRAYGEHLAKKLDVPFFGVQHHRAHVYGVAAEQGISDFVGIACDGTGYGDDGTIWGGEIFDKTNRIGHIETFLLLGGDSATRYPKRIAFSILRLFLSYAQAKEILDLGEEKGNVYNKQWETGFASCSTTSCGRVLDAAAALLGLCEERTYDGRPAMLLEARSTDPYDLPPVIKDNTLLITPIFSFLIKNLHKDKGRLAATVQLYLAQGLYALAAAQKKPIVFAGGCAYNRIMTEFLISKGVFVNKEVPAGDGGISFGQIAYYQSVGRVSQQTL